MELLQIKYYSQVIFLLNHDFILSLKKVLWELIRNLIHKSKECYNHKFQVVIDGISAGKDNVLLLIVKDICMIGPILMAIFDIFLILLF